MEPIDVVNKLKNCKKSVEKKAVLEQAWQEGCFDFFDGFHLALNPSIPFNLEKVPRIVEKTESEDSLGYNKFRQIALNLHSGKIESTKKVIEDALNSASVEAWNNWYRKILLKSFDSLITVSLFNRFLIEHDEYNLRIPVFKHQKAKKYFRSFYYIRGKYYVDEYISGDRIITLLKKSSNRVLFFDKTGNQTNNYTNLMILTELLELIPIDIVFDGVYANNTYYIFDIMPYDEYSTGTVTRPLSDRHQALCDLQDIFADRFNAKIRILPKKIAMITSGSSLNTLQTEFESIGWKGAVFKQAESGYKIGSLTKTWTLKIF